MEILNVVMEIFLEGSVIAKRQEIALWAHVKMKVVISIGVIPPNSAKNVKTGKNQSGMHVEVIVLSGELQIQNQNVNVVVSV
jgi:hypothetical protein